MDQLLKYGVSELYNIVNKKITFKVELLHYEANLPFKAESGSAGYDIFSVEETFIPNGKRALVRIGIAIEIPEWYYLRVAPRSGLSLQGIDIGAGVIDSSYRGEIKVLVINNTGSDYTVNIGDKIAQLIMERCANATVEHVPGENGLKYSIRGSNGFGSTGNRIDQEPDTGSSSDSDNEELDSHQVDAPTPINDS